MSEKYRDALNNAKKILHFYFSHIVARGKLWEWHEDNDNEINSIMDEIEIMISEKLRENFERLERQLLLREAFRKGI